MLGNATMKLIIKDVIECRCEGEPSICLELCMLYDTTSSWVCSVCKARQWCQGRKMKYKGLK